MSQTEVFRPSGDNLAIRGNLSHGLGQSADVFKKPNHCSAPPSRSSSRFGNLSFNSFFARHNPHPGRVRHLKGLLDVPICSVNDEMYMANPRYSLQFPPNNFNQNKLRYSMPANAINVNTQSYPINTITGLQYFLGKPLNFRIYGGKMDPRQGIGEVSEGWKDELKALTAAIGLEGKEEPKKEEKMPQTGRPKTQYSESTGRLIPPPSRAMSRGFSRSSHRQDRFMQNMADQFNMEAPDVEETVLTLLCQILQTDDVKAVQHWLVSSGEREKTLVMNMLKTALESQEDYYKQPQYDIPPVTDRPVTGILGDSDDPTKKIDRISLEPSSPRPRSVTSATKLPPIGESQEQGYTFGHSETWDVRPPTSDAFRPSSKRGSRPASRLATPKTRSTTPQQEGAEQPLKLKYTTSSNDMDSWKQGESTVQQ